MTTEAQKPTLDELRAYAFGEGSRPKSKLVEHGGMQFEVRTPSFGVKAEADATMAEIGEDGKPKLRDSSERDALLVVNCTYVPGTETRMFNLADMKQIKNSATGGLFTKLASAIGALLSEATKVGKPEPTSPEATS